MQPDFLSQGIFFGIYLYELDLNIYRSSSAILSSLYYCIE